MPRFVVTEGNGQSPTRIFWILNNWKACGLASFLGRGQFVPRFILREMDNH